MQARKYTELSCIFGQPWFCLTTGWCKRTVGTSAIILFTDSFVNPLLCVSAGKFAVFGSIGFLCSTHFSGCLIRKQFFVT